MKAEQRLGHPTEVGVLQQRPLVVGAPFLAELEGIQRQCEGQQRACSSRGAQDWRGSMSGTQRASAFYISIVHGFPISMHFMLAPR